MGDYRDGKRGNFAIPVPGRPVNSISPPSPRNVNVSQNINIGKDAVNAIANAVIDAISSKQTIEKVGIEYNKKDDFNSEMAMEKLADAMIVQRGNNKSNFDNLGDVKEIKKDKSEVDKTINLLSKLD